MHLIKVQKEKAKAMEQTPKLEFCILLHFTDSSSAHSPTYLRHLKIFYISDLMTLIYI